jgi:hypothetical protein
MNSRRCCSKKNKVFAGQNISPVATNGVWKIWRKPLKPNATPQALTVAGDPTSAITNSLSGRFPMKTSMRGLTMGLSRRLVVEIFGYFWRFETKNIALSIEGHEQSYDRKGGANFCFRP